MNNRIAKLRAAVGTTLLLLTAMALLFGCGKFDGSVTTNQIPTVEFATTPKDSSVFNSAPVISWFGTDPDGFVESYSFADIVDPAALAGPEAYETQIPQDAWKTTTATSDTIILLTSSGDTTDHIFYLKCTDNRGGESQLAYRRFSRTNLPPDAPQIHDPISDNWSSRLEMADTLYSIESPTTLWPGINFNWKASDPDSRVGQVIALTFKYYLIKAPNDTIQRFVSQNWTTTKTITLSGLETGSYRFEIYSRDDGLTISRSPGVAYFTVIQPSFDKTLLIYMEGSDGADNNTGQVGRLGVDTSKTYYKDLLREIKPLFPYLTYNVDDSTDVRFFINTNSNAASLPSQQLLSHYRVVLWLQDVNNATPDAGTFVGVRLNLFNEYLQIGGRMMVSGKLFGLNLLPATNINTNANYAVQRPLFMSYFGATLDPDTAIVRGLGRYFLPENAEFNRASEQFLPFTNIDFDRSRLNLNMAIPYDTSLGIKGSPGVDYLKAGTAHTVYTFGTDTSASALDSLIQNENSRVIGSTAQIINGQTVIYPPTPTNCLIQIRQTGDILSIDSVRNLSKQHIGASNSRGEVRSITGSYAFITYTYGEPWTSNDTLAVTYHYRATSLRQGKPVCTANEITEVVGTTTVSVLLSRTVFCTFPWYFQNRSQVNTNFARLLNWLLGPPNLSLY